MFCPNCAARNDAEQHYCRTCGLKLAAISREVAEQFPSEEYAALAIKKRRLEMMGVCSLSVAGIIGLMLLLSKVFYYKMILFGPEVLFTSATGALILFMLLSVFFFNYPKLVMKFDKLNPRLPAAGVDEQSPRDTNKLIDDRPFEPAAVTEHTTELLTSHRKK
jgi:hypothetical protein